jgi:hypothetical protein
VAVVPIEDIQYGVKKTVCALPEETAEEVQQEAVRFMKGSYESNDNLTGVERRSVWALEASE